VRSQVRILVAAASLLLVLSGCSSSGTPESAKRSPSASSSDPAAEDLLRASADVTKNLTSARIRVDLKGDFDRVGQASAIEGDAQARPLVVNGQVTYGTGSVAPLIVADDTVSVEIGGVWNEVGATSVVFPRAVIDLSEGLPTITHSIESAKIAGTEVVDGTEATLITGTMPTATVKDLLPKATGPANVSMWVRSTGDPVLVRTIIDFSADRAITITVSNWNALIHVTAAPTP
jgi:hypothetical protein